MPRKKKTLPDFSALSHHDRQKMCTFIARTLTEPGLIDVILNREESHCINRTRHRPRHGVTLDGRRATAVPTLAPRADRLPRTKPSQKPTWEALCARYKAKSAASKRRMDQLIQTQEKVSLGCHQLSVDELITLYANTEEFRAHRAPGQWITAQIERMAWTERKEKNRLKAFSQERLFRQWSEQELAMMRRYKRKDATRETMLELRAAYYNHELLKRHAKLVLEGKALKEPMPLQACLDPFGFTYWRNVESRFVPHEAYLTYWREEVQRGTWVADEEAAEFAARLERGDE